jgi:hypothetical protein
MASVERFPGNINRNRQERFLENLVRKGLIDNQKIRHESSRQRMSSLVKLVVATEIA